LQHPDFLETFTECECGCAKLFVSRFKDESWISFAMYRRYDIIKWPLWTRITTAFALIFTGRLFAEDICLDIDEAKRFGQWLVDHSERTK